MTSQTDWPIKILSTSRSAGDLTIYIHIGLGVYIEKPKICLSKYSKKKYIKICAFLCNWKTAGRIEAEFSLNKRAKRAENKPNWRHARSKNHFSDIRLQLSQTYRKKLFSLYFFNVFYNIEAFKELKSYNSEFLDLFKTIFH